MRASQRRSRGHNTSKIILDLDFFAGWLLSMSAGRSLCTALRMPNRFFGFVPFEGANDYAKIPSRSLAVFLGANFELARYPLQGFDGRAVIIDAVEGWNT